MAMSSGTVSVTSSATSILASNTNAKRRLIKNVGTVPVYVGSDASVTTSNGFKVNPAQTLDISDYTGAIQGITDTVTNSVEFIEEDLS